MGRGARMLRAGAVLVAMGSAATRATAADSDRCLAAPVEGQELQRAGKLLDARQRFEECASRVCPAEIAEDCARWTRGVEEALPSIMPAARDGAGRDLVDARVSVDDKPFGTATARALVVDPGPHRIRFRRDGTPDVEERILLREGEKNRLVVAVFRGPRDARAPAVSRPVPSAVWVLGASGAVGVLTFATFGALGLSDRASTQCGTGCSRADKSRVDQKFVIADIALGVSVVALGVAAVLFLTRPSIADGSPVLRAANPFRVVW